MMKKLIALLLAGAMCAGLLAGCGGGNNGGNVGTPNDTPAPSQSTAPAEDGDKEPAGSILDKVGTIDPVNEWDQYNDLIDEIRTTTDFAHRVDLMHQAEDMLMSTGAVLPLYYYTDPYMARGMSNFWTNPYGFKFFMFTKMDNGSDTLRLMIASEPAKLDPALNSSVDGAILAITSFAGLCSYDASGATVLDVAESYTVDEAKRFVDRYFIDAEGNETQVAIDEKLPDDGSVVDVKTVSQVVSKDTPDPENPLTDVGVTEVYHFTLKPDLKWSNGDKLDANDFLYSWNRLVNPLTGADYAYMMDVIDRKEDGSLNLEVSDDGLTLSIALVSPCPYFMDLCAFPAYFPVHQASVEAADPNGTNPGAWALEAGFVTNGAFTLESWSHDSSMTYVKNPNYHRADEVTLEKMEFMLSSDDSAIWSAYESGNLDFIDSIPTDMMGEAKARPEYFCDPQLGNYYVGFNVNSKLFEGKTVQQANAMRQAFALLVDRDYIVENIGQADQVPAGAFIPAGMADGNGGIFHSDEWDYYDPSPEDINDNVELARELLEYAGYEFDEDGMLSDATPISMEYLVNSGTGNEAVAVALQADFGEIGVEMSIKPVDWNVFLEERKQGNFDIAREGWLADFNDPINMLEMWTTASGNNDCQFGRYEGWKADFGVAE